MMFRRHAGAIAITGSFCGRRERQACKILFRAILTSRHNAPKYDYSFPFQHPILPMEEDPSQRGLGKSARRVLRMQIGGMAEEAENLMIFQKKKYCRNVAGTSYIFHPFSEKSSNYILSRENAHIGQKKTQTAQFKAPSGISPAPRILHHLLSRPLQIAH